MSIFGCATPPTAPSAPAPAPAQAPVTQAPVTPPPAAQPPVVTEAVPAPAPLQSTVLPAVIPGPPHIALLLPLNSPIFAKAADAVQQGFLAAANKEANGLPVRVYPYSDTNSEIVGLYQQAIRAGAVAVAGPLTRNGVAALAATGPLTTPTLAMNLADNDARTDNLYFFGLPGEAEARQAAQRATAAGLLSATVVRTDTAFSKRLAQAFSDEWQREGGILKPEIVYTGDPTALKELPQDPGDSVFIAAEASQARLLRPYITAELPVYSTSQIFSGNNRTLTNYDLSDVRFFDMPWMLQPDHPAVMIYPHVTPPLPPELERLYALGIDSYRLLQLLMDHKETTALPLDGVTGKITLTGHTFQREAIFAIMRQGLGVPLDSKSH
ncbi:penicillin-binding protein activator [Sideroxydans lithotrophicus]|uniref:penicillin-binding protein activator n=1 Tax=Sideroxydans lithotrophicus TaxID=63745 RepID=UPI00167FB4AC|nr:penicillin-binding protein activator [Sideroxydans lithotrophicus]